MYPDVFLTYSEDLRDTTEYNSEYIIEYNRTFVFPSDLEQIHIYLGYIKEYIMKISEYN